MRKAMRIAELFMGNHYIRRRPESNPTEELTYAAVAWEKGTNTVMLANFGMFVDRKINQLQSKSFDQKPLTRVFPTATGFITSCPTPPCRHNQNSQFSNPITGENSHAKSRWSNRSPF